jgi:hypothetical protein
MLQKQRSATSDSCETQHCHLLGWGADWLMQGSLPALAPGGPNIAAQTHQGKHAVLPLAWTSRPAVHTRQVALQATVHDQKGAQQLMVRSCTHAAPSRIGG